MTPPLMPNETMEVKLISGKYKQVARLKIGKESILIMTAYNKALVAKLKMMAGAKWMGYEEPPIPAWRVTNNERNWFRFHAMMGLPVYARYDYDLTNLAKDILEKAAPGRPLKSYQADMIAQFLLCRYCITAAEMGTGKSLAAIEALERAGATGSETWYVGPVAGTVAFKRELRKWGCKINPYVFTYDGLVRRLNEPIITLPRFVIFDESSRIKTPTAQRSQAALQLAGEVRKKYGNDGMVILMSGTPAPRAPVDWWHQCEVACPGFLEPGDIHKFRYQLAVIKQEEGAAGVYPKHITWRDDERKCAVCGQTADHDSHNDALAIIGESKSHEFVPGVNEIARLYKRMKGLVQVKFKKDCLDLPEKQYEVVQLTPSVETVRAAQLIAKTSPRAITALTLLRELSDGFQYRRIEDGEEVCPLCKGAKEINMPASVPTDVMGEAPAGPQVISDLVEKHICDKCGGAGVIPKFARDTLSMGKTPKDDYLNMLLDEHEDIGRIVIWGGFEGTIDRVLKLCHKAGWSTLRVDGRGYSAQNSDGLSGSADQYLSAMDRTDPDAARWAELYPKVAFVGHPRAGGMALTLTASPTCVFYSNSFDGEARMQAEDRIHRIGLDVNRGARIIDLIHLSTDQLVLDNLQKKRRLQEMSMGELQDALNKEPVQ